MALVGWDELARRTGVRCLRPDASPTAKSALTFLRRPQNAWARGRLEATYRELLP